MILNKVILTRPFGKTLSSFCLLDLLVLAISSQLIELSNLHSSAIVLLLAKESLPNKSLEPDCYCTAH